VAKFEVGQANSHIGQVTLLAVELEGGRRVDGKWREMWGKEGDEDEKWAKNFFSLEKDHFLNWGFST